LPGLLRSAHEEHFSVQAVSQQTPSTQWPVGHSLLLVQRWNPSATGFAATGGAPASAMAPASAGVVAHFALARSQNPVAQSAPDAHVVLHVLPSAAQLNPPGQATAAGAGHAALTPSHFAAVVSEAPVHASAPHAVPFGCT
jgi:hypothetical protein